VFTIEELTKTRHYMPFLMMQINLKLEIEDWRIEIEDF